MDVFLSFYIINNLCFLIKVLVPWEASNSVLMKTVKTIPK